MEKLNTHPLVGEVRACGLMGALEIVSDKSAKTPLRRAADFGQMIVERAYHHGLITRFTGNALNLVPPLVISASDLDEIFARVTQVLDDAAADAPHFM